MEGVEQPVRFQMKENGEGASKAAIDRTPLRKTDRMSQP